MKLYIDVHSKKPYPSCALSNFAEHPFRLDGIDIRCMEGLLQSLKAPQERQQEFCQMDARTAKEAGSCMNWQSNGAVFHWSGHCFSRYSREYRSFLNRAYDAMVDQNPAYARALQDTGHALLWHSIGKLSKRNTCLTTFEFVSLLYRTRRRARSADR